MPANSLFNWQLKCFNFLYAKIYQNDRSYFVLWSINISCKRHFLFGLHISLNCFQSWHEACNSRVQQLTWMATYRFVVVYVGSGSRLLDLLCSEHPTTWHLPKEDQVSPTGVFCCIFPSVSSISSQDIVNTFCNFCHCALISKVIDARIKFESWSM